MTRIRSLQLATLFLVTLCATSIASAQTVCLPLPRLLTTMPMGGMVGTQVEITITGEYIEDVSEMLFTHPGLTAAPKLDAGGDRKSVV